MKTQLKVSLSLAAMATVGMMATSAPAHAAVIGCASSIANDVSGAADCQQSTTANQDFLNTDPMTVNSEGFFGVTNWAFGGKIGSDAGYTGTQGGQSGTWDIASVIQPTWNNVMLIFKSGQGTDLVGYKLASGATSGTWTSPFLDSVFNFNGSGTKDVSHISVYYTTDSNSAAVPEPTTILGTIAAGGLMWGRKKLQRKLG